MLTGDVWDGHLVLGFTAFDEPPRRVAILGNAAGTTSRAYEEFFPDTRVDGVEIDAELSEIGREYFDMNNPRLHLYHEDARPFLRRIDAALRPDLGRRLPPALHPVLPDDGGVLRDRARPPARRAACWS